MAHYSDSQPLMRLAIIIFALIGLIPSPQVSVDHINIKYAVSAYKPVKAHVYKEQSVRRVVKEKPSETPKTTPSVKVSGNSVWDKLAQCESGGRWDYNGSSGFDGGIQFLPSTWTAMNTGYDYAWQAPREVQIAAGKKLQAQSGWGQWPSCARQLGLL